MGKSNNNPGKGKPAARWGRKATSLFEVVGLVSCPCGHGIFCRIVREGERLGTVVFFDDEVTSETHGERIERCARCGQKLELHRLLPRTPK
jgi:hypothetical protein